MRACLALLILLVCGSAEAAAAGSPTGTDKAGERIYRDGVLPSGEPVQAEREPGMRASGVTAACVNCHRRSGLGMKEGRTTIPPVAGSYLFHARASTIDDLDLPFVEGMRADRDPYTDATLARAIREGIAVDGRALSYLMPHYQLDDAQMEALVAYLKSLSPGPVPGVSPAVLNFATIITPDADPVKRRGMLDVLDKFFADQNHYERAESPRLRSSRRMMFKAYRRWQLHVWELTGAPESWEKQLRERLVAEPVLAVISGLGGKTWAPVQRFCEQEAVPCLFPNVELPVAADHEFYSLYFSKGVLLDAQLIATQLPQMKGRRVVQIYRTGDVGEAAAKALSAAVSGSELNLVEWVLKAEARHGDLSAALGRTRADDAVILWLRAADVAVLANIVPKASSVYLSGLMAGLETTPLPASWRPITRIAYGFDLPDKRRVRLDYPLGWFHIRQIPVVALQVQADTYLACGLVSETLNRMADTYVRPYLVERIEEMLEHRVITGYYPRLALAPGQRFASKGGYIVRFAEPNGTRIVADGDWIVP